MKVILTGDWQAEVSNLDKCWQVTKQIVKTCRNEDIRHVIHLGDKKDAFNPVDIRVVNFGVKVTRKICEVADYSVLLGNHDKVGMSDGTDDWFPALRAAGARTITKPTLVKVGDYRFFAVPYYRDMDTARAAFKKFSRMADPKDSVLLFHTEIHGAKLSRVSVDKSDKSIRYADLYPERYMRCYGGHFHFYQRVGENAFYVGDPFSQDWSEANQRKGFLILDLEKRTHKFVPTNIPGHYDPSWPGFEESKPEDWTGASVRIKVKYDQSEPDRQAFIDKVRAEAEQKYPGAIITVDPQIVDKRLEEIAIKGTDDDKTVIAEYLKKNCPDYLKNRKNKLRRYLLKALATCGAIRRSSNRFYPISVRGRNVLSFKDVRLRFNHKGITTVVGRNLDWGGKSNGAGKTTLMQLPVICLSGKTLKGQSGDRLINRRVDKGPSTAEFKFRLHDRSICRIIRGRRPTRLQLMVMNPDKSDVVDLSTGKGTNGTQKAIEQLTGLTWETICNALYIDQREVSQILRGTDTERKKVFVKILNLERFGIARDLIKDDFKKNQERLDEAQQRKDRYQRELHQIRGFLAHLSVDKNFILETKDKLRKAKLVLMKSRTSLSESDKVTTAELEDKVERLRDRLAAVSKRRDKRMEDFVAINNEAKKLLRLEPVCGSCGQKVSEEYKKGRLAAIQPKLPKMEKRYNKLANRYNAVLERISELRSRLQHREDRLATQRNEVEMLEERVHDLQYALDKAKRDIKTRNGYLERKATLESKLKVVNKLMKGLNAKAQYYEYAMFVFGKDGLPAYMMYQLCPQLNKAAQSYSRLFAGNTIQVSFSMREQEIDVDIFNSHGGERFEDQSQGESRIASLIASFSVREVISPCPMLILDEPGEGLDAQNAKIFGQALKKVAKRFGSVFVVTHNDHIKAQLSDERCLTVVKDHGISRLEE